MHPARFLALPFLLGFAACGAEPVGPGAPTGDDSTSDTTVVTGSSTDSVGAGGDAGGAGESGGAGDTGGAGTASGGGGTDSVGPSIASVEPNIVDPAGGSRVRVAGAGFGAHPEVLVGGSPAVSVRVVDDETLEVVTGPVAAAVSVPVTISTPAGEAVATVEAWSPAELAGARVFDASFGLVGDEPSSTYEWARLTPEIDPEWIHRDGPGLVWLPQTGRFWMIAGWSPFEPPDGWGSWDATTNEVWSTADGVSWRRELEHGNDQFDRRHFQGTLVWKDRVWLVGGDILFEAGQYQHDIVSSADGVSWRVDVAQTPWSDRMFEVAGIYEDELWVVGGQTGMAGEDPAVHPTVFHNDVWRSPDGVTWTEVAGDAPASATRWSPRGIVSKMVEFKGELWLVGGGTYDTPDFPERQYLAEAWSTTDGVTWTQHAAPPWVGRQYHTVEVFDDRLWVIGGCHDLTCNSNDAWYTDDGETWTEIPAARSPLPVSHGDGVAVGPDFLMFAGGNYAFGVGAGPDLSAWRLAAFRGAAVDRWVDRGEDGLAVTAEGAHRPVLDADALGPGIPGIVFDGLDDYLELEASDLQDAGRSVFFVARSPFNPTVADVVSPADTIVGDSVSPYCAAGLTEGALTYTEGSLVSVVGPDGWQHLDAGDGYQTGVGEVFDAGFSHAADGTIQAYGRGVAVGDPASFGYTPEGEGWRTLGASLGYSQAFVGTLGAVIIVPEAVDAATAAKVHTWAQGRFGVR